MATNLSTLATLFKSQNVSQVRTPTTLKLISAISSGTSTLPTGNVITTNGRQNIGVRLSNLGKEPNSSINVSGIVSLKTSDASDSVKGDSLQQLSTNALPPYVPIAPPSSVQPSTTLDLYCCLDCGDTFSVKSSLTFHLERRSILIKFQCESCRTPQIFYNRCAMLSHVRSHTDKGEQSDMHNATVVPLPRVFMDGIHSDFVNNLEEELNFTEDTDGMTPANLLEFSLKEIDDVELSKNPDSSKNSESTKEPESTKDPEPTKPQTTPPKPIVKPNSLPESKIEKEIVEISAVKVKCFDCGQEFESVTARKEHLTNGDKIPPVVDKDVTQCTKCGILCPSKCSFKAHQRTHLQVSPYICPECGESPNPYWDQFQAHLKYKCFHFSRAVGLKCPVCKRVVRNSEALQKHMELHTERYAKCDTCPRAFKSPAAFNAHKKTDHDGNLVFYHIIYKCALCDIVFVTKDRMINHKDEHLKEQVREYIFNCMQCGKALDSKLTLLEHLKSCHMKTYRMYVSEEQKKPKSPECITRVECMLCNCSFLSHQGYGVHIARSHMNTKIPCNFCFIVMPNRKEMIAHGQIHLKNGCLICLLCHNRRFQQRSSLFSHLQTHVEKLKFCTFCPICDEELPNASKALAHLRTEHFSFSDKGQNNSKEKDSIVTMPKIKIPCQFCRAFFDNDDALQKHLNEEHSVASVKNKAENDPVPSQPLPKRQRPSEDICAKCNFKSSDRAEFKKHILTHKTNKSTFQCQDCGLCFVVQPSLTKHLKIVHKIYDVKKYIDEEGTNFSPEKKTETEFSNTDSLMCSVCATSFPTEAALKTHMRSHGMAFIQAKQSITF